MINRVHYKNHKSSIIVHGHDQTTMNIWPSWGIFTVIPPNQTFKKVNMKIYSNFHKPCTATHVYLRGRKLTESRQATVFETEIIGKWKDDAFKS